MCQRKPGARCASYARAALEAAVAIGSQDLIAQAQRTFDETATGEAEVRERATNTQDASERRNLLTYADECRAAREAASARYAAFLADPGQVAAQEQVSTTPKARRDDEVLGKAAANLTEDELNEVRKAKALYNQEHRQGQTPLSVSDYVRMKVLRPASAYNFMPGSGMDAARETLQKRYDDELEAKRKSAREWIAEQRLARKEGREPVKKKHPGRPQTVPGHERSAYLSVALTEEERHHLATTARMLGFHASGAEKSRKIGQRDGVSDLMRCLVLDKPLNAPFNHQSIKTNEWRIRLADEFRDLHARS